MNEPTCVPPQPSTMRPAGTDDGLPTMSDGTPFVVRPMLPGDADCVIHGFEHLSERSFRRRFFGPRRILGRREVTELTAVDDQHFVLLAFDTDGGLLGGARAVRSIDGHSAEIAVTVGDRWQGRGVGTVLVRRVGAAAQEAGIDLIRGLVRVDNTPARTMVDRAGGVEWIEEPGVRGFEVPLGPGAVLDTLLRRQLA